MLELLQCLLSGYLVVTSFCRLRKTDRNTIPAIRHAFAILATINVVLFLAAAAALSARPATASFAAHPATVLALIGIVAVQFVTARFWAQHVPDRFIIHKHPLRRRTSDKSAEDHVHTPS